MTFAPEPIHADTWPAIFAILKPAIERSGDATVASLIDDLLSHEAQLWVKRSEGGDPIAAAVSELERTPRGLLVHGRLLAGKGMAHWVDDLIACIAEHGKYVGAIGIKISGRKGWVRVLSARGWRVRDYVMETRFEGAS
jgi:hypothetical protein